MKTATGEWQPNNNNNNNSEGEPRAFGTIRNIRFDHTFASTQTSWAKLKVVPPRTTCAACSAAAFNECHASEYRLLRWQTPSQRCMLLSPKVFWFRSCTEQTWRHTTRALQSVTLLAGKSQKKLCNDQYSSCWWQRQTRIKPVECSPPPTARPFVAHIARLLRNQTEEGWSHRAVITRSFIRLFDR